MLSVLLVAIITKLHKIWHHAFSQYCITLLVTAAASQICQVALESRAFILESKLFFLSYESDSYELVMRLIAALEFKQAFPHKDFPSATRSHCNPAANADTKTKNLDTNEDFYHPVF